MIRFFTFFVFILPSLLHLSAQSFICISNLLEHDDVSSRVNLGVLSSDMNSFSNVLDKDLTSYKQMYMFATASLR